MKQMNSLFYFESITLLMMYGNDNIFIISNSFTVDSIDFLNQIEANEFFDYVTVKKHKPLSPLTITWNENRRLDARNRLGNE